MAEIELSDIHLKFHIRQTKRPTLKEYLVKGMFLPWRRDKAVEVHALNGISLSLKDGDRLGVIGHNGAGKSTLLKLIAGIYPPTDGRLTVEGHISSLFEISLGFEPDATGWENIYYRSYLQGETPQTIRPKVQPRADFSELGHFLDMPVRYYSAGMMIRLAFAIACSLAGVVLVLHPAALFGADPQQVSASTEPGAAATATAPRPTPVPQPAANRPPTKSSLFLPRRAPSAPPRTAPPRNGPEPRRTALNYPERPPQSRLCPEDHSHVELSGLRPSTAGWRNGGRRPHRGAGLAPTAHTPALS